MNRNETVTIEEILDELMLQESEPSHQALQRWCIKYPEHREALSRFFATWAVQQEQTERPEIDEASIGSRMVSHALNLLHRQKAQPVAQSAAVEASRLHKMIKASGLSDDSVMVECGLDDSLLAKLDRRLIYFESIPRVCLERLAKALRLGADEVARALSGNPVPLASYKSNAKPVTKQESFLDAVASSDLAEDVKKEWERSVSAEKPKKEEPR